MKRKAILVGSVTLMAALIPFGIAVAHNSDDDLLGQTRQEDQQIVQQENQQEDQVNGVEIEDDEDEELNPANIATAIDVGQAIAIAQQLHPDAQVVKVELEHEDGFLVFSVRFDDDSRVDVDANSGTVVRNRIGDEDQDEDSTNSGHGSDDSGEDDGHQGSSDD